MTGPLIDWRTTPPTVIGVAPLGTNVNGPLGDALNAAREAGITLQGRTLDDARYDGMGFLQTWVGTTDVDNFLWEASNNVVTRAVNQGSALPHWRNIMGAIAFETDATKRAQLVARAYQMVSESGLRTDIWAGETQSQMQAFQQATQFWGSYAIAAGGGARATQQIEKFWNASDVYSALPEPKAESFVDVYARINNSGDRIAAQAELTRMSLVAGSQLLKDGVPMSQFQGILNTMMFDDAEVSAGTQVMLSLVYGNTTTTPPIPPLASDSPMRVAFEALLANPNDPDFAVKYAAFMDTYLKAADSEGRAKIVANQASFTPEQLRELLGEEGYRSLSASADNNLVTTAAVQQAAANAVGTTLLNENGLPRTDIEGVTPEIATSILGSFEDWAKIEKHAVDFINMLLGFSDEQRPNVLAADHNNDGRTVRQQAAIVSVTPEVVAEVPQADVTQLLATPLAPAVTADNTTPTTTPPPPTTAEAAPEEIVANSDYQTVFFTQMRKFYPNGSDERISMSSVFLERGQALNNVDGIYKAMIDAVTGSNGLTNPEAVRAALGRHLSDEISGYNPDGTAKPSNLDQAMEWLYPNGGTTLSTDAHEAVLGLLAANPTLGAFYQASAIVPNNEEITPLPSTEDIAPPPLTPIVPTEEERSI
jgi:broad specificity phosphatase PhoE